MSSAEGGDVRAEATCNVRQSQSHTMADNRDPASDQMKFWKEQRAAQVQRASPERARRFAQEAGRRRVTAQALPTQRPCGGLHH